MRERERERGEKGEREREREREGCWEAMDLGICLKRENLKSKVVRGGAQGPLDPGSKGLPRVFCTAQNLFCTSAIPFRTGARGFLHAGSKQTCCTLS